MAPKHYPTFYRLQWLAMMRERVKLFPGVCMLCRKPDCQTHEITMADFMGGSGIDGTLEAPICDACLAEVLALTDEVKKSQEPSG